MTVNEKIAYLKGLMEGLDFKSDTPEKKILASVVEILGDMCEVDDSISDRMDNLEEYLSELDSDLGDVEDVICGTDGDDDSDGYEDDGEIEDENDDEDDNDSADDEDDEDDGGDVFEVECPECGETIYFDESLLDRKEIRCPNCNKLFSFEISDDDEDKTSED